MTNDVNGKWVFNNFVDDIWNKSDLYESKEDCIKAAEDYFDSDESIFIGQCQLVEIPDLDVERILEICDEDYAEECGPDMEDYLFPLMDESFRNSDAYKKFEDSIQKSFSQFLKDANITSNWYLVENVEQIR